MKVFFGYATEFMYIVCGLVAVMTAIRAIRSSEQQSKAGTFIFWMIVGILFIFGKYIPANVVGILLLCLGVLTATKQVKMGRFKETPQKFRLEQAEKLGNKIFIPALLIGVIALLLSQFKIGGVAVPSAVSIGAASLIALLAAVLIARPAAADVSEDSSRLLMQVGAVSLLPQLLTALGAVFTKSGVGDVIAGGISSIIPQGNTFLGVVIYVIAMILFTMIMGNAFASFSVITVGIGIPFVIAQGGNPAIIGALGLTAGYCGTLMTPMAANFNIVPAAVLETKNKYTVIKTQLPVALSMAVVHIILMLVLGFI